MLKGLLVFDSNYRAYHIRQTLGKIQLFYIDGNWSSLAIEPVGWIVYDNQNEFQNKVNNKLVKPEDFSIRSGPIIQSSSHWSFTCLGAQLRLISNEANKNRIQIRKQTDGFLLFQISSLELGTIEIECLKYHKGINNQL